MRAFLGVWVWPPFWGGFLLLLKNGPATAQEAKPRATGISTLGRTIQYNFVGIYTTFCKRGFELFVFLENPEPFLAPETDLLLILTRY